MNMLHVIYVYIKVYYIFNAILQLLSFAKNYKNGFQSKIKINKPNCNIRLHEHRKLHA